MFLRFPPFEEWGRHPETVVLRGPTQEKTLNPKACLQGLGDSLEGLGSRARISDRQEPHVVTEQKYSFS